MLRGRQIMPRAKGRRSKLSRDVECHCEAPSAVAEGQVMLMPRVDGCCLRDAERRCGTPTSATGGQVTQSNIDLHRERSRGATGTLCHAMGRERDDAGRRVI